MNSRRSGVRSLTVSLTVALLVPVLLGMTTMAGMIGGELAFAGGSPPTETGSSDDLPANFFKPGSCDFPIRIETSGLAGTIQLPNDRAIFTSPRLYAVVTNLEDPTKTVTLNVTGAFHQTTEPNGDKVTVVTGRNLLGDPEAGLVLAIGTFSFVVDSDGNLLQPLAGTGTLTDVCGLIA